MIYNGVIDTSLVGRITIKCSENGITHILRNQEPIEENENEIIQEAKSQLKAYFKGKLKKFDLPLDIEDASLFFKSVWKEVYDIPYGKTVTYKYLAQKLNNPKAIRAVGLANAKNRIPIIIPCHRVIGHDGSMTGFAWGIDTKRNMLHLENPQLYGIQTEMLF